MALRSSGTDAQFLRNMHLYVVLGQFYIKNAGIYPENNVVLESMIICEFETKQ